MHAKRKHSDFAASSAYRWMNCPGSVALSKKAPPQPESPHAKEGTDAHECLEFVVKRFKNPLQTKTEALKRWSTEMIDYAFLSAEHIFNLRPSPSAKLLVEQRIFLKQISPKLFGTLDYAWVEDWGELVVIDYKYGAGVAVSPIDDRGEPNPQLMYYAAGLAHKHNYDFDSVKLAIIQPRVWQNDEDPVLIGETSIARIKKFEQEVRDAMKAAQRFDALLIAGDHCRFCPAAAICPENSKVALADAEIMFDVEQGLVAAPEPLMLTPETLGKILPACDKIETWIKAVREHAKTLAENGVKIPGQKLVPKRATRVWNSEAEKRAAEVFGKDIYEQRFLTPAQLEKKFGKLGKTFTSQNTASISSGTNLVPESDKRAELTSTSVWDTEQ